MSAYLGSSAWLMADASRWVFGHLHIDHCSGDYGYPYHHQAQCLKFSNWKKSCCETSPLKKKSWLFRLMMSGDGRGETILLLKKLKLKREFPCARKHRFINNVKT